MASLKYDILLIDRDTRFHLWQVKIRTILVYTNLDDVLDGFDNKKRERWTVVEKQKDSKALS